MYDSLSNGVTTSLLQPRAELQDVRGTKKTPSPQSTELLPVGNDLLDYPAPVGRSPETIN